MQKLIITALALALISAFLFWQFGPDLTTKPPMGPLTLTYWDFKEENDIKPFLADFEKQHSNIKVAYVRQSLTNYRTRVQAQIREGVGPDVFPIHNSWALMFAGDLAPALSSAFSLDDYRGNFYPIAEASFVKDNQIFGVPSEIDGLALYINLDILQGVGAEPPVNWQQFIEIASKITVRDQGGAIQTAGVAIGATQNIDHWSEILGLLLLQQPGVDFQKATPEAAEVLKFYTSFITDPKRKAWDVNLPSSTQAFAQGKLAFYFGPSWRAQQFSQQNPNLKFKIVPVPQLPNKQVAWGSFWGLSVSSKSKHQKEAWELVKFLTASSLARVDLAAQYTQDPILGAYITQAPYMKSWFLNSQTLDAGLNDEMVSVWGEGVNQVLQGQNPQAVLQNVSLEVNRVLKKYTQVPSPT